MEDINALPLVSDVIETLRSFYDVKFNSSLQFLTDVLERGHAYQLRINNLPLKSEDKLSKLHQASGMACGLAAHATIPFYKDMKAFVTKTKVVPKKKLIILTYCNKPNPGLDVLIESTQIYGLSLVIVGWGDPHPTKAAKLSASLEYLQNIDKGTIVMYVDAFDSIITSESTKIVDNFIGMNRSIIFGGEETCFPFQYFEFGFGINFCDKFYPPSTSSSTRHSRRLCQFWSMDWICRKSRIFSFRLRKACRFGYG